ncbi:MAG: TMEM14 family protein [Chloroherpetonaceae bacterium]|nr:TMEM14 family protein [Chloroherpetonaceae bacterium]MDW8436828.1 TMEM14 family protein [Chloroherpetonaceae bacterium]
MNSVVLVYGALLVALGVVGYVQSGSPTSFIGSAAGAIALVGGYLMQSQAWGKWLCLAGALVVLGGLGARLPGLLQKLSSGEETLGGAWVRLAMLALSLLFAIYFFVGLKSPSESAS